VFCFILVGGLMLLIRRWCGGIGPAAGLAWGVAVVNLVVPIAAHELDYRYVLSAVPFACLAFGLTFARRPVLAGAATDAFPVADPTGPLPAADEALASPDGSRDPVGGSRDPADGSWDSRERVDGPGAERAAEPDGESPA
jgi:hypothetical protein